MRAQLKRLTSDTAVYGLSSILGRFLNFLLVPLYTNVFSSSDYGLVAPIYSYLAFLAIIVPCGMESAYMRFVSTLEAGSKKQTFSTPFWIVLIAALVAAVCIHLFSGSISPVLQLKTEWSTMVPLCAWTIAIDAICVIPFSSLRMDNKSKRFALIRFSSILLTVLLNVWFIAILHMSIVSIFIAGAAGSLLSLILLLPTILRHAELAISSPLLKALLKVGLPTIPAGIAGMMVQVIDRPIMLYLRDATTSGIYQANYKLGIFMMLFVSMFQYAWQPFYLQTAKEQGAPKLFARVMTYFMLIGIFIFISLTLFIEPLLHISFWGYHLLGKEYWPGIQIVPIILLGYLFTGIGVIFSAGLLIQKKTTYMPVVMGTSALVNVVVNFSLIPSLGIVGAALATLASYIIMAMLYWFFTNKIYPVPYEYGRLAKLICAAALPVIIFFSGWNPISDYDLIWRFVLLTSFPILLFLFRFFETNEFNGMRELLRKIKFA